MAQYSISDLEKLTGVKAHTLRIWEKRYGICHPQRDANNVRHYQESDLQHLIKVSHLNNAGHKISSIACLGRERLDDLYKESFVLGNSGCCILDKLTLAIEKTQESKLYVLLKERLDKLGIEEFTAKIWEPVQERLAFLILSGGLHRIHLKLFDQIVERLIETENTELMLSNDMCKGSALLINTCGNSTSMFHQMVKRLLIENKMDVVSLNLCQSDWASLESILLNRKFHQVYIHYQSKEFSSPPPYQKIDNWISDHMKVIIYGSSIDSHPIPSRWNYFEMNELMNYISSMTISDVPIELKQHS